MFTECLSRLDFLCLAVAVLLGFHLGAQDSLNIVYDTFQESDTAKVSYYTFDKPALQFFESRENYIEDFDFDPTRRADWPVAHTGNPGSPVRPLFFQFDRSLDLINNSSPFDFYFQDPKEFKWLRSTVDYTRVYYNQSLTEQTDLNVGAQVYKKWSPRMDMTIHFDRMSQSAGLFQHQGLRNTSLSIGLNYESANDQYDFKLLFINNKMQHNYNGGLDVGMDSGLLTSNGRVLEIDAPFIQYDVGTTTAEGRHQYTDVVVRQSFKLLQPDSSQKFNGRLLHEIQWSNRLDHYFDDAARDGFDLYGNYLTDSRSIRWRFQNRVLSNRFGTGFTVREKHSLTAGVEHRMYFVNDDIDNFNETELRLFGVLQGPLGKEGSYKGQLKLPVVNNVGNFDLGLSAEPYLLNNDLGLVLRYQLQITPPTQLENRAIISQREVYRNGFNSTILQRIGGGIKFREWLGAELDLINMENLIYFDTSALPVQANGNFTALRLRAYGHWEWKFLLLEPGFYYQELPSFYHLPAWAATMHVRFKFSLAQDNLKLYLGGQMRYFPEYRPDVFLPWIGQFALQEEYSSPNFPLLDLYIGMYASGFRAYFRLDNTWSTFNSGAPLAELVHRQPYFPAYARIGFEWTLFN
ncbi:MAG TPA: putative porin [Saprospiraceae bacterium]|nr:putative porin [Saprospiraceae bacterium]